MTPKPHTAVRCFSGNQRHHVYNKKRKKFIPLSSLCSIHYCFKLDCWKVLVWFVSKGPRDIRAWYYEELNLKHLFYHIREMHKVWSPNWFFIILFFPHWVVYFSEMTYLWNSQLPKRISNPWPTQIVKFLLSAAQKSTNFNEESDARSQNVTHLTLI